MQSGFRIGEVAERAGVSIDTVRYYERQKLLPKASRTEGGFRLFTSDAVERVHFIKQAQSLGFSLSEIKQLLIDQGAGLTECQRVRDLLNSKLDELDVKLRQMRNFRKTLATYLGKCEAALSSKQADGCPVLFEIKHPARPTLKKKRGKKQ